ncbi:MAG TPA: polysaccharide deacetylase family protein [Gemmatimonadaceae bacterium]|jgi:peptidoglycan/xylan/chitin deacetylase (PgdA/CDA1 family)|nr:polysaccharide deacetylase family protein [Gemmatimonadaceae bacterium]
MILGAALGVAAVGAAAHGAFHRNSPVFGLALGHLPAPGRTVALTFDDGPNPEATPRILDALAAANVKATFFILGRHAERWPRLVRRVHDEGHAVGNHGYYHRKLHFKSPRYVREDLTLGTQAIEAAGGGHPHLFRAPHGFRSPWVTTIARSLGQRTIGWSLGVWDSARPGADVIADRTINGARPGSILLLHDGDGYDPAGDRLQTAEALPHILRTLTERGFHFATVPTA